jgi:hypothetical protein
VTTQTLKNVGYAAVAAALCFAVLVDFAINKG